MMMKGSVLTQKTRTDISHHMKAMTNSEMSAQLIKTARSGLNMMIMTIGLYMWTRKATGQGTVIVIKDICLDLQMHWAFRRILHTMGKENC